MGHKKRYSDFSPTLEEQGMLLAMGKRGEQSFNGNGSHTVFELNLYYIELKFDMCHNDASFRC